MALPADRLKRMSTSETKSAASTVQIVEVLSKKQQKEFLNFPLKMYKDSPHFAPPMWVDEKKIFNKDYAYYKTCEAVYFNAYRDGKMVGRISGIIQKTSNEMRKEKRARFTRFDAINDQEVANALFGAVEKWAKNKGMDTICGPLGFSDLEREGLLIEGFDEMATFEEQYNAEYYQHLINALGYEKEVDWTENKLYVPEGQDDTVAQMSDYIAKRFKLHFDDSKNLKHFVERYAEQFFEMIDVSYSQLYGTVPLDKEMQKMLIANFRPLLNKKYLAILLDENEKAVCIGICFPSMTKALQKSSGHFTPAALLRLFKAIRKPEILDLGLVGIDPAYANRGVSALFMMELMKIMKENNIKYAETNLTLEENHNIQNQWKRFTAVEHKRRRSYIKRI